MEKQATEVIINKVKLSIIQGDITKQGTNAIVNAAKPSLVEGGGVDGAADILSYLSRSSPSAPPKPNARRYRYGGPCH